MIIGENNLRLVQFAISLKPFWRKKTVFWCMNKNVSIMPKLQPGGSHIRSSQQSLISLLPILKQPKQFINAKRRRKQCNTRRGQSNCFEALRWHNG